MIGGANSYASKTCLPIEKDTWKEYDPYSPRLWKDLSRIFWSDSKLHEFILSNLWYNQLIDPAQLAHGYKSLNNLDAYFNAISTFETAESIELRLVGVKAKGLELKFFKIWNVTILVTSFIFFKYQLWNRKFFGESNSISFNTEFKTSFTPIIQPISVNHNFEDTNGGKFDFQISWLDRRRSFLLII